MAKFKKNEEVVVQGSVLPEVFQFVGYAEGAFCYVRKNKQVFMVHSEILVAAPKQTFHRVQQNLKDYTKEK